MAKARKAPTRRERKKQQFERHQLAQPEQIPAQVDVIVIGAGASGLIAAYEAAIQGASVLILERDKTPGHSILITGDGRCNILNTTAAAHDYHEHEFVAEAFRHFGVHEVMDAWMRLGVVLREEEGGRAYPLANKSAVVLDALLAACERHGVHMLCATEVSRIERVAGAFAGTAAGASLDAAAAGPAAGVNAVTSPHWRVFAHHEAGEELIACAASVIVATSAASAAELLRGFCLIYTPRQILGPLRLSAPVDGFFDELNNTRIKCALYPGSLYGRAREDFERSGGYEEGEVTLRDYGLSGILAFNLSRLVSAGEQLYVDFLPDHIWERNVTSVRASSLQVSQQGVTRGLFEATGKWLLDRAQTLSVRTYEELLDGIVLSDVARFLCQAAQVRPTDAPDEAGMARLGEILRAFPLTAREIGNTSLAQGWRGGVDVHAVNPATMEVSAGSGLYVCGEALNVDGPCGGYNLTWAWASGVLAGRAQGKVPVDEG